MIQIDSIVVKSVVKIKFVSFMTSHNREQKKKLKCCDKD